MIYFIIIFITIVLFVPGKTDGKASKAGITQ